MENYMGDRVWCQCTPETAKILHEIAATRKIPGYDVCVPAYDPRFPNYYWNEDRLDQITEEYYDPRSEKITVGQMMDWLLSYDPIITLNLNEVYTAQILSRTEVKVGCQTFHIDAIKKLVTTMENYGK